VLSIIITSLNEKPQILNQTIRSILDTSPEDIEIIVIDDCSDTPVNLEYKGKNIKFERNKFRLGAAQSKHNGVTLSSKPYVFLTDAHVLFVPGWHEETLKTLENKPNSLFCGTCLGLSEGKFDLNQANGAYVGARLFLYDKNDKQILDGKWINNRKDENNYEISCVMGANYFMHKSHFFKIRGFSELRAWGSEEPCLSLKTWLSGGEVRLNKDVKIGHMFRDSAPYITNIKEILYNKIRMSKSFFDKEFSDKLISKIPDDINKKSALELVGREHKIIEEHKNYYKSIFVRDINWLCEKFKIEIPEN